MKIDRLDIESEILGKEVFSIDKINNGAEYLDQEIELRSKYNPFYVQYKVDAENLEAIHSMEDAGFRFVEFRLKKLLDTNSFHKVSELAYYPYIIKVINDEEAFNRAENIIKNYHADDRFSRDPVISGEMSQNRLLAYLRKSFENTANESIYGLFNKNTQELLGIKTIALEEKNIVIFSQTAFKEALDVKKFTFMMDALLISHLMESGKHFFYSITSGLNIMEMDLHLSDLKYKNLSSTVILRKIYQ